MKRLLRAILVLLLLSGCQQQSKAQKTHLSQIENDFASGVNVVLDYVSDGDRTFIIVDVDNRQGKFVDLWLVQQSATIGQKTMSSRRFYTGNSTLTQKTFRVQMSEPGITETIYVEVFDGKGLLLFETQPISNTQQGGVK